MKFVLLALACASAVHALQPTHALNNPCIDASSAQSNQPWCNVSLPIDERVADMLSRMTISEKIDNLDTDAGTAALVYCG